MGEVPLERKRRPLAQARTVIIARGRARKVDAARKVTPEWKVNSSRVYIYK